MTRSGTKTKARSAKRAKAKPKRKRQGYVYILTSPALKADWYKIGKTTRAPDVRAREISRSTGVPVPYEVIYHIHVSDCHEVEKRIHANLSDVRAADNREFFVLPLKDAVDAVQRVARDFRSPMSRFMPTSPMRSPVLAVVLEVGVGLVFQTFGLGQLYAGRSPSRVLPLTLGYWLAAMACCGLIEPFNNMLAIAALWVVVALVSSVLAARRASRTTALLAGRS